MLPDLILKVPSLIILKMNIIISPKMVTVFHAEYSQNILKWHG